MLVCMKCHMEYEEGTPFCSNCGGDLVTKEAPKPIKEDKKKEGEVKADGRLVCPKCHILYEKLTTCIRCGAPLVTQSALKEMKESQPPPPPEGKKTEAKGAPPSEVKKEPSAIPSPKKPPVEPRRGEPKQPYAADMMQEPSSLEAAETGSEKELPEDKKEKVLKLEKREKSFFYSLHGILSIILLLMVAAYFLISHFLTGERVGPRTPSSKKTIESPQSPEKESSPISKESSPDVPSSAVPVVLFPQEIQKLSDLLENIRQANLRKDINLLMSCYASDYKDPEERRRTALQSWSNYNYLDLDYALKVESVSTNDVKARVEWRIRSIPMTGGQIEEGKSALSVIFQKEKNEWKIKEVTPIE
jgi:RNA polymerase subunit RPABC4/transcription elongation factor Spt4